MPQTTSIWTETFLKQFSIVKQLSILSFHFYSQSPCTKNIMPDLYIPPAGFAFRLLGLDSNRVVVGKNGDLEDFDKLVVYADQWFTLAETPVEGSYYIKSTFSANNGKVMYLKEGDQGIYAQSEYDDQYLVLDPGTGDRQGWFRIVNRSTNRVLCSKKGHGIKNWLANKEKYDDQYFCFLFEDTEIDHVEYDFNKGKILQTKPDAITDTLRNEGTAPAKLIANLKRTLSETSSFQDSEGFTITVGAKATIGVPGVVSGEISTQLSTMSNFTWGHTSTVSKEVGSTVEITVPGGHKQEVVGTIRESKIDVLCTIYSKSVKTGVQVIRILFGRVPVKSYGPPSDERLLIVFDCLDD